MNVCIGQTASFYQYKLLMHQYGAIWTQLDNFHFLYGFTGVNRPGVKYEWYYSFMKKLYISPLCVIFELKWIQIYSHNSLKHSKVVCLCNLNQFRDIIHCSMLMRAPEVKWRLCTLLKNGKNACRALRRFYKKNLSSANSRWLQWVFGVGFEFSMLCGSFCCMIHT